MKRMFFLVLALLLSATPLALAQKQTLTGSWNWMWPSDALRQAYPNIHAMAVGNGNVYMSVIIGDTADGLYISRDSGSTFSKVTSSAFGNKLGSNGAYAIWTICAYSNYVFVGADQYIFRSTDYGENWTQVQYNYSESYQPIIHYDGDTLFSGGGRGIYRSIDNGGTWVNVDSNDLSSRKSRRFNYVNCFTVTSNGYIYAGTGSGLGTYSFGILRSTDGGSTWAYANNGITKSVPDTTDWNADITSLASVGDTVFAASTHLYRSTDNGQSWQAIADNLFYNNESGYIFSSKKGLIVPTLTSFYLTTDGGDTWYDLIDFPQTINVWSAAQGPNDSTVLMGMWNGLGKLVINDPVTPVIEHQPVPQSFQLSQNYPNPFNPTTTISYSLPKRAHVSLVVYNTLGELVATLVDGEQSPGIHEVKFDGSRFSSGIYLCRLVSNQSSKIIKMVLLK